MPEPRKTRWLFWTVAGLAAVALVPVFYLLSVGPAYWLYRTDRLSWRSYQTYVDPALQLLILTDNTTFERAYGEYLRWWKPSEDWKPPV